MIQVRIPAQSWSSLGEARDEQSLEADEAMPHLIQCQKRDPGWPILITSGVVLRAREAVEPGSQFNLGDPFSRPHWWIFFNSPVKCVCVCVCRCVLLVSPHLYLALPCCWMSWLGIHLHVWFCFLRIFFSRTALFYSIKKKKLPVAWRASIELKVWGSNAQIDK